MFYLLGTFFLISVIVNGFFVWFQYQNFMANLVTAANVALVIKHIVILLFTKICLLLIQGFHGEAVSRKTFFSLFIPFGLSTLIYISILYTSQIYTQLYGFGMIQLNLILLICLNLYFLYLLSYLSRNAKTKSDLELLQRQSDMHQMMNCLGQSYYTANHIFNIILNDKAQQAKKLGIEMVVKIGDIDLSEMKDVDITTIFGNLLDNAIEAASPHGSNREEANICIKADSFHEFTVISICNTIANRDYGKERGHKGLGLMNVKTVLETYHGGMQTKQENEEFHVSITIPKRRKRL